MRKNSHEKLTSRERFARLLQTVAHKQTLDPPYDGPLKTVVILAQEKYGDVILLTPLLRQLKKYFPVLSVHVITFSMPTYVFFSSDSNVDRVYLARKNLLQYFGSVLSSRFNILFNTKDHPSVSFLLQSMLIRADRKVGIACEYHRGIYDYLVDVDYYTQLAIKNCGLLGILGVALQTEDCRPYIPEMVVSAPVAAYVDSLADKSFIAINISAGGSNRYWQQENWIRLISSFHDMRFLILSAPGDREKKEELERRCSNVLPSIGTRNLYQASLIIKKASILVTPDTSMVHVASATGTSVLGLYCMTTKDQIRFSPFLVKNRIVVSSTETVRDIGFGEVVDALREMIDSEPFS